MAGEYGDKCQHIPTYSKATVKDCDRCNVGRPHYHAVLFGCSFDDLVSVGSNRGETVYSSPSLEAIWAKGHVQVGEVNFQSCAYVARYVTKKITGVRARDHYSWIDDYGVVHFIEPEYNSMSNGIGKKWFERYKDDCFPSDEVPVPGVGVLPKVPRYYESIYAEGNPEGVEEVKRAREVFAEEHKEDYTPERLMDRYKVKKAQVALLKRELS